MSKRQRPLMQTTYLGDAEEDRIEDLIKERVKEDRRQRNEPEIKIDWTYSTIKQFCQRYPVFTEGGVRFMLHEESKHHLRERGCVVRVGGRILVHEKKFLKAHGLEY